MSSKLPDRSGKQEEEEETRWTDDKIRWEENDNDGNKQKGDGDDDDSESDAGMIDPFKDPNPIEETSYRFPNPHSTTSSDDELSSSSKFIEIVLRAYKEDADAVWQSTGLTIWRASQHLCDYLVEHAEMFQDKRTLELGAGLGQCSILLQKMTSMHPKHNVTTITPEESADEVAAKENKTVVTVTDGDTDALVFLRENVDRNQADINSRSSTQTTICCHQLLWGKDTSEKFLQRHCSGATFDFIIASDIIYAKCIIDPLWETIQTLLSTDGVFILAFAKRRVPIQIDFVLQSAEDAGFCFHAIQEDVDGIFVYEFRRKS